MAVLSWINKDNVLFKNSDIFADEILEGWKKPRELEEVTVDGGGGGSGGCCLSVNPHTTKRHGRPCPSGTLAEAGGTHTRTRTRHLPISTQPPDYPSH
ncbi:hypothetical protein J6590_071997 [Homalodisca vitripennis]|nr:hypothetical protein J6590_071997 [Homalodisca vitripennis]